MMDWKLSTEIGDDEWDLLINKDSNFDLPFVTGIDYLVQKARIKLQFFLGEWFLDTTLGVDWYGVINVKNPNLVDIDNLLKLTITEIEGISKLTKWQSSFNLQQRKYSIVFVADSDFGELSFNEGFTV